MNLTLDSILAAVHTVCLSLPWAASSSPNDYTNLSSLFIFVRFIPFLCRLSALVLAIPFLLCIGLDIIAYAIARTLHLSMSQTRIPRSPPVDRPGHLALGPDTVDSLRMHTPSQGSVMELDSVSLGHDGHTTPSTQHLSGRDSSPRIGKLEQLWLDASPAVIFDYPSAPTMTDSDRLVSTSDRHGPADLGKRRIAQEARVTTFED